MSAKVLKIDVTPDCSAEVSLDGRPYLVRLRWNERGGAWFLTLSTLAGAVIVRNTRIVLSTPALLGVRHPDRPPGELVIVDNKSTGVEPGLDDLGSRCKLCYVEAPA